MAGLRRRATISTPPSANVAPSAIRKSKWSCVISTPKAIVAKGVISVRGASRFASCMAIATQKDPEPERGLLRRADQWSFLAAGIPATAFVFGYRPGGESERIYRQWYRTGYHRPQDDLAQSIDWIAAAKFNRFFYTLVALVADEATVPAWKPSSVLCPMVE